MTRRPSATGCCGITSPRRCCASPLTGRGCGAMPSPPSPSRCPTGAGSWPTTRRPSARRLSVSWRWSPRRAAAPQAARRGRCSASRCRSGSARSLGCCARSTRRRLPLVGLAGRSRGVGDRAARRSTAPRAGAPAGWRSPTAPRGQGAAAIERLVHDDPAAIYALSVRDRERTRALLRANAAEPDVLWLDRESGQVYSATTNDARIPVLVGGMTGDDRSESSRDEAAKQQRCPSCGTKDAIRFLGSSVTTLASVGITQMFGSPHVADDERKLLAFTDSVQDASHRAAFFSGRTHRFNLRATMSRALQERGRLQPDRDRRRRARARRQRAEAGGRAVLARPAGPAVGARPQRGVAAARHAGGGRGAQGAGQAARLRRDPRGRPALALRADARDDEHRDPRDRDRRRGVGAPRRVRQGGGPGEHRPADHRPTTTCGRGSRVCSRACACAAGSTTRSSTCTSRSTPGAGGSGAAAIGSRRSSRAGSPRRPSSAPRRRRTSTRSPARRPGSRNWARKVLGIDGAGADRALRDVLHELVEIGVLERRDTSKGVVWGLPAARIDFVEVARRRPADRGALRPVRDATPRAARTTRRDWLGRRACGCAAPGTTSRSPAPATNYYRALYRQGRIRRVVAAEHTGLLTRAQRETVETGFKDGGSPDAPNVLAATPTLGDGHRHRRPVGRDADRGPADPVQLRAARRARRPPDRQRVRHDVRRGRPAQPVLPPGPRADDRRRDLAAQLLPRRDRDPPAPVPRVPHRPRRRRARTARCPRPARCRARSARSHPRASSRAAGCASILDAGRGARAGGGVRRACSAATSTRRSPARLAQWAARDMAAHVERVIDRWRAQLDDAHQPARPPARARSGAQGARTAEHRGRGDARPDRRRAARTSRGGSRAREGRTR